MLISCCKFSPLSNYRLATANIPHSAASAIAGNTFLRSLAGAGFPLFATQMFDALGVNWTGTLLGCVAVVLVPIPAFFYYFGARIRARSAYAPTHSGPPAGSVDEDATPAPVEKTNSRRSENGDNAV